MPLPCSLKGDVSPVLTLALFLFPLRTSFSNFLVFLGLGASWDVGLSVSGTNGFPRMWAPVRTPVNWSRWSPCQVSQYVCVTMCVLGGPAVEHLGGVSPVLSYGWHVPLRVSEVTDSCFWWEAYFPMFLCPV